MDQAIPIPRKTFTAFEPVTLPTDASAVSSWTAATLLANVSVYRSFKEKERVLIAEYQKLSKLPPYYVNIL